jgi:glyoxylate reductase
MKVLVTQKIPEEAIRLLKANSLEIEYNKEGKLSKEELIERIKDKDGVLCLLTDIFDREVIESAKNLKVIANVAVGYDNIDVKTATKRRIMVTNTPDVLTETTADLTFALILSTARRVTEADRFVREGKFRGWDIFGFLGYDVYGKTLGIYGMGRIGLAVARRGKFGFNMEVIYHDVKRNEIAEKEIGAQFVSFDELLERSDFLTIHVPLTEETRHRFTKDELRKMKRTAFLINTARGPIVKEDDLVWALKRGWIRGAGLDVYEFEPAVHEELKKMENFVTLLPHIGSATVETRTKMAVTAAKNLITALKGEIPPNLVNKEIIS